MIRLTDEWAKSAMARAVPGAFWSPDDGAYVVNEPTARAAAVILKLFPQLQVKHPELVPLRDELLADVRPFDMATPWVKETSARLAAPRVRKVLKEVGYTLHGYQETDLAYASAVLPHHKAFYLGWERGLGKTLGTCCLIDELDAHATLVVSPNTAKESVWGDELRRFCPWLHVIVMDNTKARRDRALRHAKELFEADEPFVLVVHYEALAVIAGKTKAKSGRTQIGEGWGMVGVRWDLMVTDEDHRLANPKAQMYKAACKVPSQMRLLLSGSIIQNHLEELYSPHHRAFPDRYRSQWKDWNDRFLDYVENGYAKVCVGVKPERVPALRQELGVWMSYRRKEDELDLPPKTYVHERIALTYGQALVYEQLVRDSIAVLDDQTVVAADVGVALLTKLRQVATGVDLVSEDLQDSSKLDRAVELIMDSPDDDFVVFSWYRSAVTKLAERLEAKGVTAFCVTGDTKQADRTEMIARFQAGEGRVFIGTLSTLGESVNLQRANTVIRLDRSWNPMLNVQAEDRVFRQGQKRNVTVYDLVAKDTVDELNVLPVLASKEALRAAILGGA